MRIASFTGEKKDVLEGWDILIAFVLGISFVVCADHFSSL